MKKLIFFISLSLVNYSQASSVKLWLDTSSMKDDSIIEDGEQTDADGTKTKIKNIVNYWTANNKLSEHSDLISVGVDENRPVYVKEGINGLPAVKFSGNLQFTAMSLRLNKLKQDVTDILKDKDFTIFIVDKPEKNVTEAQSIILCDTPVGLFVRNSNGSNTPRILSFMRKDGGRYYSVNNAVLEIDKNDEYVDDNENSIFTSKDMSKYCPEDSTTCTTTEECYIGAGYNGHIGEIILIDRILSAEERKDIFNYLSAKWSIKGNSDN
jgi:hypothetical protein